MRLGLGFEVTFEVTIHNGILRAFKHMARNKHKNVLRTMQLVVLMKILCSSFFVCSNCHSDVNRVTDYNLGFLLLFKPLNLNLNNLLIIDAG